VTDIFIVEAVSTANSC